VEVTSLDDALERRMELARSISSMVLRARNKTELNVRQPLQRILLPADDQIKQDLEGVESIILDEVNVKEIETVDDDQQIVHKAAKPNFPVLGKKVGGAMKDVAKIIQSWSSEEVHNFEQEGGLTVQLEDGERVQLESEDVEIIRTGLDGWSVESEQGLTIAVDVALTESLIHEGLAREFVNRVQNMRKEASYDVTDRIEISYLSDSPEILGAMTQFSDTIQSETLAESLTNLALDEADFTKTWDFDGRECTIAIMRKVN
jgi:isoleucyl-tRNA synthetase